MPSGSGYGYGYGSGYGYGDGYGERIGSVGVSEVLSLAPWPYIRVGCQVRSIAEWRERWAVLARKQGVSVAADEAERLLALADERVNREREGK